MYDIYLLMGKRKDTKRVCNRNIGLLSCRTRNTIAKKSKSQVKSKRTQPKHPRRRNNLPNLVKALIKKIEKSIPLNLSFPKRIPFITQLIIIIFKIKKFNAQFIDLMNQQLDKRIEFMIKGQEKKIQKRQRIKFHKKNILDLKNNKKFIKKILRDNRVIDEKFAQQIFRKTFQQINKQIGQAGLNRIRDNKIKLGISLMKEMGIIEDDQKLQDIVLLPPNHPRLDSFLNKKKDEKPKNILDVQSTSKQTYLRKRKQNI